MRILKRVFSVIVPGGFLLLGRRYLWAAVYFAVWVLVVQARLVASVMGASQTTLSRGLTAAAAAILGINSILSFLYLYRERRAPDRRETDSLFGAAMAAFAAGRDDEVERIVRKLLRVRAFDPDCLFLGAQSALRTGKKGRARRLFRKCACFDEEGKWAWEIRRALERL